MPSNFEDYANQFEHAVLERDDAGVLVIRLHTEGGPLMWAMPRTVSCRTFLLPSLLT